MAALSRQLDSAQSEAQSEPAAAEPVELLPGWQEAIDSAGKIYYWNVDTSETTWERPVAAPEPERTGPLWEQCETTDGRKYFYNTRTGKSTWTRPATAMKKIVPRAKEERPLPLDKPVLDNTKSGVAPKAAGAPPPLSSATPTSPKTVLLDGRATGFSNPEAAKTSKAKSSEGEESDEEERSRDKRRSHKKSKSSRRDRSRSRRRKSRSRSRDKRRRRSRSRSRSRSRRRSETKKLIKRSPSPVRDEEGLFKSRHRNPRPIARDRSRTPSPAFKLDPKWLQQHE